VIEQGQPWPARRDLVLQTKGARRRVRVHHEDEREQPGLAHGRTRRCGLALYTGNRRQACLCSPEKLLRRG
jgi:hypothetical protein